MEREVEILQVGNTKSHNFLLPSEPYCPAVHSQLRQLSSCISLCKLFAEPKTDKQSSWNKMRRAVKNANIRHSQQQGRHALLSTGWHSSNDGYATQLNPPQLDWTGLNSTQPRLPPRTFEVMLIQGNFLNNADIAQCSVCPPWGGTHGLNVNCLLSTNNRK